MINKHKYEYEHECEAAGSHSTVYPADEFLELVDARLNARLSERVIVLDAVEQFREAPVAVGFEALEIFLRQGRHHEGFDEGFWKSGRRLIRNWFLTDVVIFKVISIHFQKVLVQQ